jgi:hypothetical protein
VVLIALVVAIVPACGGKRDVPGALARLATNVLRSSSVRKYRSFTRHKVADRDSIPVMEGKPLSAARERRPADRDPVLCFVDTGGSEPRPRVLVERLLYARGLLQASAALAPRFLLGDCAAAHHIVLPSARTGIAAAERLGSFGFQVEPWLDPPGLRFVLSSAHTEAEIHALLVAITMVVREVTRR